MLKKVNGILLKPIVAQQVPSRQRWNSLRYQYLKKSPIIRVDPDGTFHVEGVSNKQTPIPVLWREPVKSNFFNFIAPLITIFCGATMKGTLMGSLTYLVYSNVTILPLLKHFPS